MGLANTKLAYAVVVAIAVVGGLYFDADARPGSTAPVDVFRGLARGANKPRDKLRFALGYNVCLDAIARAADVLGLPTDGTVVEGADHAVLASGDHVRQAFMRYFGEGAAAERSCDAGVLAELVAAAEASPTLRKSLGGNAALMARRLAEFAPTASSIVLGGHVGPDARALLPPSVALAAPPAASDEVHLILEYARGEALGGSAAPRANRFIVTADASNTDASALLATIAASDAGKADSLTVAGLHMLEPLPAVARSAALASIAGALAARAHAAPVHIELASCADAGFVREVASALFPHAASLGFNEQEGAFLYEALGGKYGVEGGATGVPGPRSDVASTRPSPVGVGALLRFLLEAYPASLSRLHYHSLAFHVVAYARAAVGGTWRGNAGAVAAGSVAATTQACGVNATAVAPEHVSLLAPLTFSTADPRAPATCGGKKAASAAGSCGASTAAGEASLTSRDPVASWVWDAPTLPGGAVAFRLAPVAVCAAPQSTVGLGDAVSATGLAADVLPFAATTAGGAGKWW